MLDLRCWAAAVALFGGVLTLSACFSGTPSRSYDAGSGQLCSSPTLVARGAGLPPEPRVAVILIDGAGSEEGGGDFYPLAPVGDSADSGLPMVSNYCPVNPDGSERGFAPTGLNDAIRRWSEFEAHALYLGLAVPVGRGDDDACKPSGGLRLGTCLVAELANAGAVLLPFSYAAGFTFDLGAGDSGRAGALLEPKPEGVVFRMKSFDKNQSRRRVNDASELLDGELATIHAAWPDTRIVLLGHSYGGLVAENWWQAVWSSESLPRRGVTHVFSLDGPINGVRRCRFGGAYMRDLGCSRWDSHVSNDEAIVNLDQDGSFTAIGTVHDPGYADNALMGGGGLEPQVVVKKDCPLTDDQDAQSPCIARPVSYVSMWSNGSPTCGTNVGGPNCCDAAFNRTIWGVFGHDLVRACPTVIKLIVDAVKEAGTAPPSACNAFSTADAETYANEKLAARYTARVRWVFPDAAQTWGETSTLHVLHAVPDASSGATGATGEWYFFFANGCAVGEQVFGDNPRGSRVNESTFKVTYDAYRPGDSNAGPTGGPATARFQWNGSALTPALPIEGATP
jgi:hypothetical protein